MGYVNYNTMYNITILVLIYYYELTCYTKLSLYYRNVSLLNLAHSNESQCFV